MLRTMEMPATNGRGTARSIAERYGAAVAGGGDFGLSPGVLNVLATPALPPMKGLRDKALHVDTMFSLGFIKPFSKFVFGSSNKAFGTAGAGGSFGFADPDTGIGFCVRHEPHGFSLVERSERARPAAGTVPRCTPSQAAVVI